MVVEQRIPHLLYLLREEYTNRFFFHAFGKRRRMTRASMATNLRKKNTGQRFVTCVCADEFIVHVLYIYFCPSGMRFMPVLPCAVPLHSPLHGDHSSSHPPTKSQRTTSSWWNKQTNTPCQSRMWKITVSLVECTTVRDRGSRKGSFICIRLLSFVGVNLRLFTTFIHTYVHTTR